MLSDLRLSFRQTLRERPSQVLRGSLSVCLSSLLFCLLTLVLTAVMAMTEILTGRSEDRLSLLTLERPSDRLKVLRPSDQTERPSDRLFEGLETVSQDLEIIGQRTSETLSGPDLSDLDLSGPASLHTEDLETVSDLTGRAAAVTQRSPFF